MTETWPEDRLAAYVADRYDPDETGPALAKITAWLGRGDGAAVYENHDLGHSQAGAPLIVSFGSPGATLPGDEPPAILPDWPGAINWRYALVATCRRETPP